MNCNNRPRFSSIPCARRSKMGAKNFGADREPALRFAAIPIYVRAVAWLPARYRFIVQIWSQRYAPNELRPPSEDSKNVKYLRHAAARQSIRIGRFRHVFFVWLFGRPGRRRSGQRQQDLCVAMRVFGFCYLATCRCRRKRFIAEPRVEDLILLARKPHYVRTAI
jgi:hypothetical protein